MVMTTTEAMAHLGHRLTQWRIAKGLTQAELAKQTGVSTGTIIRIEAGWDSKLSNLIKIFSWLGLEDRLLELVPNQEISPIRLSQNKGKLRQRCPRKKKTPGNWKWGNES